MNKNIWDEVKITKFYEVTCPRFMIRILYWYFLFKQTFVPIVRKVEETTDYMIVFYSKKDLFIHSAIWINLEIFVDMYIVRLHNFVFLALNTIPIC